MLFSKLLLPTLKDTSSDVNIISVKLMIKSGMIRKLSSGLYEFLPLAVKIIRKIENIIRNEMNYIGGQEIILPTMFPKKIFIETSRWDIYGKELFKFKDRKNSDFCLSPTSEEVVVDFIRKNIVSYKQLPIMLYQIGSKFRDEIRPRFGVLRSKEFLMKDAYSFHINKKSLNNHYDIVLNAYRNIFTRCGLNFQIVEATSGAIGGSSSHEFIAITNNGEDQIVLCDCGYGANVEKAEALSINQDKEIVSSIEEVATIGIKSSIDVAKFFKVPLAKLIKTIIYIANDIPIVVLIRGDHKVNEEKLKLLLSANRLFFADEKIIFSITNTIIGFIGPIGLKNIKIIADLSVINIQNAIVGSNKENYHIKNVNYDRDYKADIVADIRKISKNDICPKCKKNKLIFSRGIEVGHIFKLNTKYSRLMNATYIDEKCNKKLIEMGCFGIGITRIIASAIEQFHDINGIIWPKEISPFDAVIIPINFFDKETKKITFKIYEKLSKCGIDVLLDDRDYRVSYKFKDADLIGIPYKIIINCMEKDRGIIEIKSRCNKNIESTFLNYEESIHKILKILNKL
ncbi:MAG: proline--tRNA ligase [Endomicrobium sp.]|jgi:prolyl-tRNA synthetase|nr:proline--tRNA ligase [Endomicrobium sp.]